MNDKVSVRDNVFAYVRDNPIEPERRATNWRVSRNRFFNSYAWLSLDGVYGGPFYVWANIGWHDASRDSLPAQDCIDGPQWLAGRWWDFAERDMTKNPKPVDWRDYDPFCGAHIAGTVMKLSWEKNSRLHDFYMFNNSWMISNRSCAVESCARCRIGTMRSSSRVAARGVKMPAAIGRLNRWSTKERGRTRQRTTPGSVCATRCGTFQRFVCKWHNSADPLPHRQVSS